MAIKLNSASFADRFNEYGAFVLSGGYLYDGENREAINACIDVLEKNETGLVIIGNPGSGKTLFFEMAQRIIHPLNKSAFVRLSVLDIVLKFNDKAVGHSVFRLWKDKNVFFDDLGTEDKGYLWGEKVEVFEKFIQFRYDLFRNSKVKTHFTTNLSGEQLKERYGLRCYSRLNEMCTIVMMGASSKYSDRRKLRNFIGLPYVHHEMPKQESGIDYEAYKKNQKENPPPENIGLGSRLKKQFGL